ncbi:hypothetical protein HYFRA_00011661 [Hymenoscyphus fraxineus]|uniref:Manganese lipoxygenase n=1 Tax=Hymenoscyphus fraxineus TaxID=746836 RepID=A0A9N9PVP5_9HELO|nr:hypothetical protein HYFRA_00011661 [Hymenoscyphus fraxineus]
MFSLVSSSLVVGLALQVAAFPSSSRKLERRNGTEPYSLPYLCVNATERNAAIQVKRDTFLYGPSIAGNTSFYPTGSLGSSIVQADVNAFTADGASQRQAVGEGQQIAAATTRAAGGIKQLSDFELLYKDQWQKAIPDGIATGILTNYTDDLFFSMSRLSVYPYSIVRLDPAKDVLEFEVEDSVVASITGGNTLSELFTSGALFYADHRSQDSLEKIPGRFAATCDAYFYIHPTSGDFLPLAVRTNVGSNLIYTPADLPNDWLLAKMAFNLNDFWDSQWYHFAATHHVVELVYEAAFRSLSDDHPVMAILQRLTPQLFAMRQVAIQTLLSKNGFIDQLFASTGAAAGVSTTQHYHAGAGKFQANYFIKNLEARNLINSFGPELKHFPFLEDATPIHASIQKFITSFVESYYTSPKDFAKDTELQAWISEAVPAKIFDFPTSVDKDTLIDILTHVAFLGSAAHHTMNTNDISEAAATLPLTPVSLYKPLPSTKGVTDLIPFLPNVTQAIGQISVVALFARPNFIGSEKCLVQMFNGTAMLGRMNEDVGEAAKEFAEEMLEQSEVVSSKAFDADGLSQGMPFIWRALDPQRAPYFLTI